MNTFNGLSQTYNKKDEYIRGLDDVDFCYSANGVGETLHISRIHVVNDAVMTFSDHEASSGIFYYEAAEQEYLGLRFLRRGEEKLYFEGSAFPLHANECALFLPSHMGRYKRMNRTQGINLMIPLDYVGSRMLNIEPMLYKLDCTSGLGAVVQQQVFAMEYEIAEMDSNTRMFLTDKTVDLVRGWLLRSIDDMDDRQLQFRRITEFIDSNLHNPNLNLALIAEQFHMSRRSVQAIFASMGLSVSTYMMDARLERTCSDLLAEGLSITDVAYRWGFYDASYFCKAFKRRFGCSPGEYRRR